MLGRFVQNVPYSIKIFLSSRDYLNIHEMEYQNPLNSLTVLLPQEPSLVNFKSTQTLPDTYLNRGYVICFRTLVTKVAVSGLPDYKSS